MLTSTPPPTEVAPPTSPSVPARYYADLDPPIVRIDAVGAFSGLTEDEKRYAHHLARAAYHGTRIILRQRSIESEAIFSLVLHLFSHKTFDALKEESGLSDRDWNALLQYSAQVLSNNGNYKSIGDSIIVPRVPESEFGKVVAVCGSEKARPLFESHAASIYATNFSENRLHLGFLDEGHHTAFYSGPITQDEIGQVQKVLEAHGVSPLNTRLEKSADGEFLLKVASSEKKENKTMMLPSGGKITVEFGDHAVEMAKIVTEMRQALKYAPNDTVRKMIELYITSFETGDMNAHKESQRLWVKDIGPVVETNLGFLDPSRDPAALRAEWEGFVAVVNKERSRNFQELVKRAPEFIKQLPWTEDFEPAVFSKPDFTSLEVLAYAAGYLPAGINIPNYDDVRVTDGFKNVSLGNVVNAQIANVKLTFVTDADAQLMEKLRGQAYELQVGIHELLGHGTGKLLTEESAGVFNFDKDHPPVSPLDGKPVTSYYKPGETYFSVFGPIASSYEECRAEAVSMYLSTSSEILAILGNTDPADADDAMYVSYLMIARAGVLSLEYYQPKKNLWGQAHARGRYAILQCFLRAGEGFVRIEETADKDLVIYLDRNKIRSVGMKAVGELLQKLHVYKCTADIENAKKLYEDLTAVPEEWMGWRDIVVSKKLPRKVYIQGNSKIVDDIVVWVDYEPTLEGLITSWLERLV
ncbi:hypothetical protein HDU93_009220 [Gonapodya sp. JEL0774]|nr:hypothetical protein HDU93_009220 [Gonapodya sp. JEL0774]